MISAGLFETPGRFTCCVIDQSRWPRYLSAPRTDETRQAISRALRNERVTELVMLRSAHGVDPLGQMLLRDGLDVWLASTALLDDLAALLRGPRRRCGPRTCAAILARMPYVPTWFAALRPLSLPITPPSQLSLI
jgi:hypothetical protein